MLALLQSGVTGRRSLGKGGSEVEGGYVLSSLMFQFLENGRGTLPIGAPEGLGEIQILAKSVLSSCILSS